MGISGIILRILKKDHLYRYASRVSAVYDLWIEITLIGGSFVEAVMAKKSTRPEKRVRVAVTNIRSVPEWKEWLARFAVAQRKDVSDLVDDALLRMARAEGFELPPKR